MEGGEGIMARRGSRGGIITRGIGGRGLGRGLVRGCLARWLVVVVWIF